MTSSKQDNAASYDSRLTERDYLILQDIALCGGLTAGQISTYRFNPTIVEGRPAIHSNCQRRLKLMREASLIKRIERYQLMSEGKKPYLYTVTLRGAQCLATFLGCAIEDLTWRKKDTRLRPNYVEHLLKTNDVRLAIQKAVEKTPGVELVKWYDELTLAKEQSKDTITLVDENRKAHEVTLIPDAYFVLRESDGELRSHFLEIDLASEVVSSSDDSYRTWARKIKTYLAFFLSERYKLRYGTTGGRLLTVTTGAKRLTHLKAVSETVGAKQRFWFSTFDLLTAEGIRERNIEQIAEQEKGRTKKTNAHLELVRPNVLCDPLWVLAGSDDTLHALRERGHQLRRQSV